MHGGGVRPRPSLSRRAPHGADPALRSLKNQPACGQSFGPFSAPCARGRLGIFCTSAYDAESAAIEEVEDVERCDFLLAWMRKMWISLAGAACIPGRHRTWKPRGRDAHRPMRPASTATGRRARDASASSRGKQARRGTDRWSSTPGGTGNDRATHLIQAPETARADDRTGILSNTSPAHPLTHSVHALVSCRRYTAHVPRFPAHSAAECGSLKKSPERWGAAVRAAPASLHVPTSDGPQTRGVDGSASDLDLAGRRQSTSRSWA